MADILVRGFTNRQVQAIQAAAAKDGDKTQNEYCRQAIIEKAKCPDKKTNFSTAQCSSGTRQSKPHLARPVKR